MGKKILLIYPMPSMTSPQKSPPLSILYVGEALKTVPGYEVRYFDERYDYAPDLNWPDVVGVSSMTGYQLKGAIHWLKMAKLHGKRTILGGIHATMQPEQCLSEPYVDSVVLGEGEWAIQRAIEGERIAKVPLNGNHVSPVSPETLIHFQRSAKSGDTILLTSRGCRFRCGFCYVQKFFERRWESVDLDRWKKDVIYLRDEAGVTKYEHGDDWIGKWDRARGIIQFLYDNGIGYRPSIRANQINDLVALEMSELGIRQVSIGMESGSRRILELVQKDITPEDQIRCAKELYNERIWPLYYWIVGFPTETPDEINQTLDQMDRMASIHHGRLTQNIYAYTALPGTPLFELVDQSTLPRSMEEWSNYSLNHTNNELANNLYHIGGLHFHKGKGEKTDRNFPGLKRLKIAPFEISADLRWKLRYFDHYTLERNSIEYLLRNR